MKLFLKCSVLVATWLVLVATAPARDDVCRTTSPETFEFAVSGTCGTGRVQYTSTPDCRFTLIGDDAGIPSSGSLTWDRPLMKGNFVTLSRTIPMTDPSDGGLLDCGDPCTQWCQTNNDADGGLALSCWHGEASCRATLTPIP